MSYAMPRAWEGMVVQYVVNDGRRSNKAVRPEYGVVTAVYADHVSVTRLPENGMPLFAQVVRHVSDPKMSQQGTYHNGFWDYTPAHKEQLGFEQRVLKLEDALAKLLADLGGEKADSAARGRKSA